MESGEIRQYQEWIKNTFGDEAVGIDAWLGTEKDTHERKQLRDNCLKQLSSCKFPYKITYLPHLSVQSQPFCRSPFRHLHITWNGQCSFCTDFTDFSCGSVRETPISQLFTSIRADNFRREIMQSRCVTCGHCSWRYKESFLEL